MRARVASMEMRPMSTAEAASIYEGLAGPTAKEARGFIRLLLSAL